MAIAILATPVMAKSPKKIQGTINRSGPYLNAPPAEGVWTSGNVQHGRGFTGGWNSFGFTGDGISFTGSLETYYGSYNFNLKRGHGQIHRRMVLILDGGTFEGEHIVRGIFQMGPKIPVLVDGTIHVVFHGTGDFLGWTLSVTGEAGNPEREAYLLIP